MATSSLKCAVAALALALLAVSASAGGGGNDNFGLDKGSELVFRVTAKAGKTVTIFKDSHVEIVLDCTGTFGSFYSPQIYARQLTTNENKAYASFITGTPGEAGTSGTVKISPSATPNLLFAYGINNNAPQWVGAFWFSDGAYLALNAQPLLLYSPTDGCLAAGAFLYEDGKRNSAYTTLLKLFWNS